MKEEINNTEPQMEAEILKETAASLENLAENEEAAANAVIAGMGMKEEDFPKVKQTVNEFVSDYARKDENTTDKQFLVTKFNRYPHLWKNQNEVEQTATDIVETVYAAVESRKELDEHLAQGKRRESWIAKKLEQGAALSGVQQVSAYAGNLDAAIAKANTDMARVIRNIDGSVNQNPNLDGLIAEQHHANTFNLDAAQKEKAFTAETLQSNGKNSVDVVVRDERGNIVRKYQSKYGKDAETTEGYFENGNYRGQRKLVPKGQGDKVNNANEKIQFTDKKGNTVESKPLSKEEAKAKQEQAQKEGKLDDYTWNDYNKGIIAKSIGKKAALSSLFAVGFQGARIAGRRIWNWVTGQENQSVEEDVKEFAEGAIKSGANAGLTVATSGALTVAARSGWLGKLLTKTPAGHIAAAATIGIENVKTLYKVAKGEVTGAEAVDQAGRATCSVIGGMAGSAKGASVGGAIGTVLGPAGTVVGAIAGGTVGAIAGSTVGEAVFSAGKKVVKVVVEEVKNLASKAVNTVKNVASGVFNFIGRLFGW